MDQTTLITSAEELLKTYGVFVEENNKKLENILQRQNNKLRHRERLLVQEPLIKIDYLPNNENLAVTQILENDRFLNKVLLTFFELCTQIDEVTKEAQVVQVLFLYLDEDLLLGYEKQLIEEDEKTHDKQLLLKMSESIEFLCRMQFLLQRCIMLGNMLLQQCGALTSRDTIDSSCFNMKLKYICDYMSTLVYHILIFDHIIHRSTFARFWPLYKKTVEVLTHSAASWQNCTQSEVRGLQNSLEGLNFIFTGSIFRHFLDSTFALKGSIASRGVGLLTQQFNDYIKQQLNQIEKYNTSELNDFMESPLLIKLNAFCVVFHEIYGQVDGKSIKHLLELNSKCHGIMLVANIPWSAAEFLCKNAYPLVKPHEKHLTELKKQQQLFLNNNNDIILNRCCRSFFSQLTNWTLQMNASFNVGPLELKVEQFKGLTALMLQGVQTAGKISSLIKGVVTSHESLQQPMTKHCLLNLCKLLEMLKMVQITFKEYTVNIAKIIPCIIQYMQYKLMYLISSYKKKLISSKIGEASEDALAALKIMKRCLLGPPSTMRLLVAKLAFDACHVKKRVLSSEQQERFRLLIQQIEMMSHLQTHISHVCDASLLFWHQSILTAYLKYVVDKTVDFNSFQYLIGCVDECGKCLDKLGLNNLYACTIMKKSSFENLRSEIISKLCAQIEIYLRLEVHCNLPMEKLNGLDQGINDYAEMINAGPLEINGSYIILKDHVENYLSAMFYNLTTISLHDWKTYEEMRHLANKRLMLNPVDDYLPNQTLEQGIDILEIMRKIHAFVAKYVYNMNSQMFVEQQSANKHLDTIGIRHVANSLRTHGTGVISTTVNFTYQFLRQKFYTFSQFLYDEQINARLMKEVRSLAEHKQADKCPLYPYERAEAFNKDIRKLGLSNDGQTYMDLFRKVITHVGNALGYIRLVRSGSIHANYSTSLYLPKFNENLQFSQQCLGSNLCSVTLNAAENVEMNIENLIKTFADGTDFFKLLVDAFQPFFRNPCNMHLKSFYLIVPAVTMNYVEYMLAAKDKISKRDHEKAVLFDDGFAIGLAYILKLLDQIGDFNSLQWFATVRQRFEMERQKIKEMLLKINSELKNVTKSNTNMVVPQKNEYEKLQQTMVLTERRISVHQMEYNLLFYNLCSAKIFFQ